MRDFVKKQLDSMSTGKFSRYYTGAILICIVALVIILNIAFLTWILLGACYFVAFSEAMNLFKIESRTHLFVSAALIWLIAFFYAHPLYVSLAVLAVFASYNAYFQNAKSHDYLPLIYPTIPFLCMWTIYKDCGAWAIVWLIVSVSACDICAYFGGRMFGKTPLSPVSPKKTIEGAIIGLISATLIGTIVGVYVRVDGAQIGFVASFFITLLVAFISIFGDLYESMLKRLANVKDSGNILPGHGGVLDRLDGMLFGAIMMLFLLDWAR